MPRKIFYSFHFDNDFWRVQTVRNIGSIEGNKPVQANKWEEVKQKGDAAVEKWIDDEMIGKSCVVVLVGSDTANRKWVKEEIKKGWAKKKGVVAIAINGLKDNSGNTSSAGVNPFSKFDFGDKKFSDIVEFHKPPSHYTSQQIYSWISENIDSWIEKAIKIRQQH